MLVAGVLAGLGGVWLVVDQADYGPDPVLGLFVGWSFIASGLVASLRRPENDLGLLMVVIGFVWFVAALLKSWEASVPVTAGVWLGDVWWLPLAFLLVGFPTLSLQGWPDRAIIGAIVMVLGPLELLWLMCLDFADFGRSGVPRNALLVWDSPSTADAIDVAQRALVVTAMACLCALLLRRWWRARGPLRRVMHPVLAGALALALFVPYYASDGRAPRLLFYCALLALSAVPLIFLAGLLRARLARSAIGDLLVELREPAAPGALKDALAKALRDPSLELAYHVPEYEAYVDHRGEPVELDGRVATFVERGGVRVAAILHDPALRDEPELVGAIASAAGIALENERLQADLRARLADLRASRARIVEAGDTARRKLERDLHDGAQQRLVGLSVVLRVIANKIDPDTSEARLLASARTELTESLEELRNLARGLHPAILSDHGLEVALESLAARATVTTTLVVDLQQRPPLPVEVAAYYVIAEGLTNVAKYAEATSATVTVQLRDALFVEVADDGRGGADPGGGSGIRGLADRVEALDGRLKLESPPGGGTRLRAEIPCA